MSIQGVRVPVAVIGFVLSAVACTPDSTVAPRDEEDPRNVLTPLLISAPSSVNGTTLSHLANGGEATYAYVSAPPASVPGVTASIANRTRDRQSGSIVRREVPIEDGGFGPIPITASAGDTLQIEFLTSGGSVVLIRLAVVPKLRPPKIVRTTPRPGKKDVPLNARFEIVFSEPIDPATIRPENIRIVAGGAAVIGSLVQTNDFTVEFVPAELLRPETSYQIVIGTGVRNLGGVALESEFSLTFDTGTATESAPPEPPAPFGCSAETQCLAFVRDGGLFTTPFVSTGTTYNAPDAARAVLPGLPLAAPVWSPDGHQLAFVTPSRSNLCVVGPDGAGSKCIQVFVDDRVSWSPDGSELAFVGSLTVDNPFQPIPRQLLALKTTDMTLRVILGDVGKFCGTSVSWSPDGSRIAFTSLPSMCGGLATVRPDGSDLQVVASLNPAQPIRSIAWAPDGLSFAAMVNMREEDCPGGCDAAIGTLKVDGTAWQPLVTASWGGSGEMIESPTWSPDGSAILYGAGSNCFMGCSDYRIQFVKRDGSGRGTVLVKAAEPSVRPVLR
jgi:hypothetical protein